MNRGSSLTRRALLGAGAAAFANDADAATPVAPADGVIVLAYHGVGLARGELVVTPAQLDAQLGWLRARGVEVVAMRRLLAHLDEGAPLPARSCVLTFDDGLRSAFDAAFPLLDKHAAPFTLAINTAVVEQAHPLALTWRHVEQMTASGLCEIASHGHTHIALTRLGPALLRQELATSRDIIRANVGEAPRALVYPYAEHRRYLEPFVQEEGYRAAFGGWGPPITARSARYALPRRGVRRFMTLGRFATLFPYAWR